MENKIRIALVDDHTLFRSGLKALLSRQADFEVVGEASDGLEGVKLVEHGPDGYVAMRRAVLRCAVDHHPAPGPVHAREERALSPVGSVDDGLPFTAVVEEAGAAL